MISHLVLDNKVVKEIVEKNFNKVSPYFYKLINEWMIDAYKLFRDLDKYLILIYVLSDDFKFFYKKKVNVSYDEFYSNPNRENTNISIQKISKELNIPKESVRRKVLELTKNGLIERDGKNITLKKNGYTTARAQNTLKNACVLFYQFNMIVNLERNNKNNITYEKMYDLIKAKFSFHWHHFYIFLFAYCKRWRTYFGELEIFLIGHTVVLNSISNATKQLKGVKSYTEKWMIDIQNEKYSGMNVMSISEITGIPRATVIRKVDYLLRNNYIGKNKNNLLIFKANDNNFKSLRKLQEETLNDLSNLMTCTINEII